MTKKTIIYISIITSILIVLFIFRNIKIKQIKKERIDEYAKSIYGFMNVEAYRNYEESYDLYRKVSHIKRNIKPGESPYIHSELKQKELLTQSMKLVEKSIKIEPGVLKSIELYADLLERQKEYKKALKYYAEAYKFGMKEIYYRNRLFYIYKNLGDSKSYKRELYNFAELIKKSKNSWNFESLFVQLLLFDKPLNLKLIKEYYEIWIQIPGIKDKAIMRSVRKTLNINE